MTQQPALYVPQMPAENLALQVPDVGRNVDNLWRIVWRRRWRCLAAFVFVALLGVVFLVAQPPSFTAHAVMAVASTQPDLVATDQVSRVERGTSLHASDIESEIQLLTSTRALLKIVQDFQLDRNREFQAAPHGGALAALRRQWNSLIRGDWEVLLADLPWPWNESQTAEARPTANGEEAAVELLRKHLKVEPINNSTTIDISFTAQDPDLAAKVTNAIANAYIANRHAARREDAERAARYLKTRSVELRQELAVAEQAVEDFRATNVLRDGRDIEHVRIEMEKANAQFAAAKIARIVAVSKLEAVEARVRELGIVAALEPGETGLITLDDRLREMAAQSRAKMAALADYGQAHPELQRARKEAGLLQSEVVLQANTRLSSLKSNVTIADQQMRLLESALQNSRSDFDRLSAALTTLKSLERQAAVSRTVYEAFLSRVKVTEQVGYNEAQSWIISPATAPIDPSSPKVLIVVGGTLILAIGAALSLALLAEHKASQTILSSQHFTDKGLKALGIIPRLGRRMDSLPRVLAAGTRRTNSPFSASIEAIFTSVMELTPQAEQKSSLVLLVTSTLPFEGKSTTIVALAAKMASTGNRVLLIDADLRAPQLHRAFGISIGRGLTALLDPTVDPNDVLHVDWKTGISLLTAGAAHPEPQNVLRSQRLIEAIDTWRANYDFILIDSPPVLPISDARILVPLSDYCIFVTHWRKTRWTAAMHALRLLRESGARLAGVVVSKVDVKQLSTYEFAESEMYGHAYRRYGQMRGGDE
jgi:succinoglycan biosynthesis transport protein ExoP